MAQVPAADACPPRPIRRGAPRRTGAHRLEHPVARRGECFALDAEHRLVVQRRQQREHRVLVVGCGDMDGGGERTAACEHREPAKQLLLGRREMVVAPVSSSPAASRCRGRARPPPVSRRKRSSGAGPDLVDREHRRRAPRRARSPARCRRGGGRSRRRRRQLPASSSERRLDQPGRGRRRSAPLPSRADRREARPLARQRQRAHRIDLLAGDAETPRAAGRDRAVPGSPRASTRRRRPRRR